MDKIHIIALELPFLIDENPKQAINACALKDGKLHTYTRYGELLPGIDYYDYIDTVEYAIKEQKYEWCDFGITEGKIIYRNSENQILIGNSKVDAFRKLKSRGRSRFSDITLRLFNDFLKETSADNPEMVKALDISLKDGYFRTEIEEIVKNDALVDLNEIDRQIIVRCKLEGKNYIKKYVDQVMASTDPDKYVDINYFYRRIFNLEINNYISFHHD